MNFDDVQKELEKLLASLYSGLVTIEEFYKFKFIIEFNFFKISNQLTRDIKKETSIISRQTRSKINNIARFSHAKTYQQVLETTKLVLDENGVKTPFKQFKEKALKVNSLFNDTWLKAEQDLTVSNYQNQQNFLSYQELGVELVRYVATGDNKTRPSHEELNGTVLPINHSFWNTHAPENGHRCRCLLIPEKEDSVTSKRELQKKSNLINEEFKKDKAFAYNPAKVEFVFKEKGNGKHEYFKVPKKDQEKVYKETKTTIEKIDF